LGAPVFRDLRSPINRNNKDIRLTFLEENAQQVRPAINVQHLVRNQPFTRCHHFIWPLHGIDDESFIEMSLSDLIDRMV
jgi:hypothetical protein